MMSFAGCGTQRWTRPACCLIRCGPHAERHTAVGLAAPDAGAGVHLSAWQSIDLPRQWDKPDREPDDWPEVELADFIERVRRALQEWEGCLECLSPAIGGRTVRQ